MRQDDPRRTTVMRITFQRFCENESGAVTVDWVVLSAAIIGMGMLALTPIAYSTDDTATRVATNIGGTTVGYQAAP